MRNFAIGLTIVIIATFFILFSKVTTPFDGRKIGDPIRGYWYYPELAAGCFQSSGVIQFTADKMLVVMGKIKKVIVSETEIVEIKIGNGEVKEHLVNNREIRGRDVNIHEFATYKDSGNILTVNKSHGLIEGRKIKLKGPAFIRHCSSPTFWGKIKLALRMENSFNPANLVD